jgi:hypothetical protein
MQWGTYRGADLGDGRPTQIAPCDRDGFTEHCLYEDCPCCPVWDDDRKVLVHRPSLNAPRYIPPKPLLQ